MYKYLQFYNLEPQVVVDISEGFEKKMASIKAHKSQFFDPNSTEPETVIASEGFFKSSLHVLKIGESHRYFVCRALDFCASCWGKKSRRFAIVFLLVCVTHNLTFYYETKGFGRAHPCKSEQ